MTNKKLTDKEIIKALEWYVSKFKNTGYVYLDVDGTKFVSTQEVLDLITRQQAENENLKVENQSLRSAANSLKMHYEEAQAEIERLNKVYQANQQLINALNKSYFLAKSEAYKECVAKVRKLAVGMHPCSDELRVFDSDLDNLLKGWVGDNNA